MRGVANSVVVAGDNNFILFSSTSQHVGPAHQTLLAYLSDRLWEERFVKFKQVGLETQPIQALFIDLPLLFSSVSIADSRRYGQRSAGSTSTPTIGAAEYILRKGEQVLVINAGPGQGKSTVMQFVCQVERAHILGEEAFLAAIPAGMRPRRARVPFLLEFQALSEWLSGNDPYVHGGRHSKPRSLEAFLCHSISTAAGGLEFSVDALHSLVANNDVLLAMDALDEVADLVLRENVLHELSRAIQRLRRLKRGSPADLSRDYHPGLSVVITSRPTANDSAPALPFEAIAAELGFLGLEQRDEYLSKWASLRLDLSTTDRNSLEAIWRRKKHEEHVLEITRTPMQLAILLHLIHTRGESLPDKRTVLYREYVKTFFEREVLKDATVADNVELLQSLHGELAWQLQSLSEHGHSAGRLPRQALKSRIIQKLKDSGKNPLLADSVMDAVTDRVYMLVERRTGEFEFEIQPIREFFAAQHLYETLPMRPGPTDGKAARFEQLARRPYWLNVARFYAGMCTESEVADLSDLITSIYESRPEGTFMHVRQLATLMLQDRVFDVKPYPRARVISIALDALALSVRAVSRARSNVPFPDPCRGPAATHLEELFLLNLHDRYVAESAAVLRDLPISPDWLGAMPDTQKTFEVLHMSGRLPLLPAARLSSLLQRIDQVSATQGLAQWFKPVPARYLSRISAAHLKGEMNDPFLAVMEMHDPAHAPYALLQPMLWNGHLRLSAEIIGVIVAMTRRSKPTFTGLCDLADLHLRNAMTDEIDQNYQVDERPAAFLQRMDGQQWAALLAACDVAAPHSWLQRVMALTFATKLAKTGTADRRNRTFEKIGASDSAALMLSIRRAAGRTEWWRDELRGLSEEDDLAFWVVAVFRFTGPTTFLQLSEQVEAVFRSLPKFRILSVGMALEDIARGARVLDFQGLPLRDWNPGPMTTAATLPFCGPIPSPYIQRMIESPGAIQACSALGGPTRQRIVGLLSAQKNKSLEDWAAVDGLFEPPTDWLLPNELCNVILMRPFEYSPSLVSYAEASASRSFFVRSGGLPSLLEHAGESEWSLLPRA